MKMRTLLFKKLKLILLFMIACFALNTQTVKGAEQEVITFRWKGSTSVKGIAIAATSGKTFSVNWGNGTTTHTGKGTGEFDFISCIQEIPYGNTNEYTVTITAGSGCVFTTLLIYNSQAVSLDVSKAPSLNFLDCAYNSLTSLKINPSTALYFTTLNCVVNNIPLADLKALPSKAEIGPQTYPEQTVNLNTPITVDDAFYGEGTNFAITLNGSTATANTHYTTAGGKITFKSTGKYEVTMKNSKLGSASMTALINMTFNVVKSTDATLSALTVSQGTLSPTFNASTLTYTVDVAHSVTSLTINATKNDMNATFTGDGTKTLTVGDNPYNIVVTAQDGSTKTYKVTVRRAGSSDANLSALTVSQGTLSPTFNASTLTYTVNVANTVTSITINATKNEANASVTGDGTKTLTVGDNEFNIVVTAQDGTTKKTYKVTVTRAGSSDATLSALTVSQGTLSPTFNASTQTYSVNVAHSVTSITINATKNEANAAVTGDGTKTLNVGDNSFDIVVTAQDGTTKKTYKVTVTRAKSSDATLSALTVSQGTLSPTFNASTLTYSVNVANSVTSITINATKNEANAAVTGDGTKNLTVGDNSFDIVVTAQDGTTKKTYKVTVTRAKSSDATLSAITLSTGTLSPGFNASTLTYTVNVAHSVTSITINATKNEATATVTGDGAKNLNVGNNQVDIVVTAQDGTTKKTYKVTVTRAGSSDATLSALTVSQGTLSPTFNASTLTYTVNVANTVTSITINATKNEANATFTGDGTKTLNVGDNSFDIVVTAQDGTTKKTYKVTVTRAKSPDATLSALTVSTGTLSPGFSASTLTYTVNVPHSVTLITINATKNEANATFTGDGTKTLNVGDNSFDIVVTAQDGTTKKTYKVTVRRAGSSEASLSALTVSQGTLSPVFNASTLTYTVDVAHSVTSITINATQKDANATVSGGGDKNLNVGDNPFDIVVTAQDGSLNTYTVIVRRAGSSDATLSAITLSTGTLSPAFNASTLTYTVDVAHSVTSLTINATPNEANATFTGDGTMTLTVGDNPFDIVVTAQDGTTKKTYKVTITRAKSSDATLSAITLSTSTLSPGFNASTLTYTVDVAHSVTSITINATKNEANATFTGDGTKTLSVGDNPVDIVVTAQDGTTKKTYKVIVRRAPSTDATLSSLTVSKGTLSPAFNPSTLSYSVAIGYSSITINATANDTNASVTGTGMKSLSVGENTFEIVVTAEDGSTKNTYKVTVIYDTALSDATLSSLTVSQGELSPAFERTETAYTVIVDYVMDLITVNATVNETGASFTGGGQKILNVGSNPVEIEVTAKDGNAKKTYQVNVIRKAASTDAALSSLTVSKGTLIPEFDPDITTYTVNIDYVTERITINAAVNDTNASFTGDGEKSLSVGDNIFELVVNAQDGSTQIYEVNVVRKAASADATLSALTLSQGTLIPAFNPDITDYTVNVPNSATTISFGTMISDSGATVTIKKITTPDNTLKQAPANTLRSTSPDAMTLDVGVNFFEITVTAEDGSTRVYMITVIREAAFGMSSDTRLSALWLSDGTMLTPEFKSYIKNYTVTVENETEEIKINATPSYFKSSVGGTGVKRLNHGENTFDITVTAEDGTQDIYTITITREGSAVGLEKITRDPIRIYPNPMQDYFSVKGITEPATVSVYSLQGSLMLQRKAEPDEHIYVGNLAKGIYLVRVNGMAFKVLKR